MAARGAQGDPCPIPSLLSHALLSHTFTRTATTHLGTIATTRAGTATILVPQPVSRTGPRNRELQAARLALQHNESASPAARHAVTPRNGRRRSEALCKADPTPTPGGAKCCACQKKQTQLPRSPAPTKTRPRSTTHTTAATTRGRNRYYTSYSALSLAVPYQFPILYSSFCPCFVSLRLLSL